MNIICKIFLSSSSIGSAAVILLCRFEPNRMGSHFCSDDPFSSTYSRTPPPFSSTFLINSSRSRLSSRSGSPIVGIHSSPTFIVCLTDGMLIVFRMVPNLTSPSLREICHSFYGAVIAISSSMKVRGNHNKTQNYGIQQLTEAVQQALPYPFLRVDHLFFHDGFRCFRVPHRL